MKTYAVVLKLKPKPTDEKYGQFSGAHATVWVKEDDQQQAQERAEAYLANDGWDVTERRIIKPVQRENCMYDASILAKFDRAQTHGVSAEVHIFRSGGVQFN